MIKNKSEMFFFSSLYEIIKKSAMEVTEFQSRQSRNFNNLQIIN